MSFNRPITLIAKITEPANFIALPLRYIFFPFKIKKIPTRKL